jgi:tetratricopeptide (TPR) repeat protein
MMLKIQGAVLVLVGLLLLGPGAAARAQTPQTPSPAAGRSLAAALRVVRPLLREDPEKAIQVLVNINKQYPTSPQVLNLLGDSYLVVGRTDSAVAVYRRCLRTHPTNVKAGAALGTLFIQMDQREQGDRVFQELLSRTGNSINTYRNIGSTLSKNRYYDLALGMYEEGRRKNTNNYVLTLDIAHLHRTMGNFQAALDEYLFVIDTSPKHYRLARDKILELARDSRATPDDLLTRLRTESERERPHRKFVMNILSLAYLEQGMIESALEIALDAEEVGVSDGKVLFNLAERTITEYRHRFSGDRAKYFDLALRSIEAFLEGHPTSPQMPRAKLMLIDLLVDLAEGRVENRPGLPLETATNNAIGALDWVIATFPGTDHAESAYLKKGDVVLRLKKNPQEALEIYKLGLSKARFQPASFAERLGRLYLVIGEYENAAEYFGQLIKQPTEEIREAGVFYAGLLLGIQGEYETARDTLVSLAEGNPASQFANDAIQLAWVIEEGLQGDQKILDSYIGALEFEVADDTTAAVKELGSIVAKPVHTPLRSRALFRIGELYQASGALDEAIETYNAFVREYPTDIRVPDAHRRMGQVYEHGYGNMDLALKKYEDILLTYPHYIFLDEVREDVTRLRDHTVDQQ